VRRDPRGDRDGAAIACPARMPKLAAILFVVSCSQSNEPTARALFLDGVYPILVTKCATCHATAPPNGLIDFVDLDPAKAYATATGSVSLVGDYTPSAQILGVLDGGHLTVVSYTADQIAIITEWLAEEHANRE
jgi:hypothetical protein